MASQSGANFTAAINALVAERDRVFLLRVAADYNLKFEELQQKYLETAEVAIKVPRKYTKKPKSGDCDRGGGREARKGAEGQGREAVLHGPDQQEGALQVRGPQG